MADEETLLVVVGLDEPTRDTVQRRTWLLTLSRFVECDNPASFTFPRQCLPEHKWCRHTELCLAILPVQPIRHHLQAVAQDHAVGLVTFVLIELSAAGLIG